jgi:hypothetical protein
LQCGHRLAFGSSVSIAAVPDDAAEGGAQQQRAGPKTPEISIQNAKKTRIIVSQLYLSRVESERPGSIPPFLWRFRQVFDTLRAIPEQGYQRKIFRHLEMPRSVVAIFFGRNRDNDTSGAASTRRTPRRAWPRSRPRPTSTNGPRGEGPRTAIVPMVNAMFCRITTNRPASTSNISLVIGRGESGRLPGRSDASTLCQLLGFADDSGTVSKSPAVVP